MNPLGGLRKTGGLPLFSPRRAHLLTTASAQTPYPSPRRKRQVSSIPLCLLFPQSQRLCGSPFAAVVCLRHRALSEGDCGCCDSLQTMPQHLRVPLSSSAQTANSLRRAQRIGAEILYPMLPPACANLPPAALPQRWAGVLPVHFLFYERETEKRNEVNERWQFTIWKPKWSAGAWGALL